MVVVLRRLDLIDVNAVAETFGENERCFQLRCNKRVLTDTAQCGITLAPMADIADGLAEAVRTDDQHDALGIRRNDRLMRRVRLERQTPGAVGLNEHIVGKPRERVKGERRRAELSRRRPRRAR